ncbi:PREDICTED: probable E3 ubiquitin-protein ligase TRIM8 [Poecilia mexicana]|uniref:Uncharacterized protein n=1 Tax=Poecilia mexicana TaxID=48701 RepID=A0A3B3YJC5_9TELE|nr:PREDICTED: probable E3 ubiquitin-protein ligase TRIM8 [Poecilia mexicana]
MLMRQQDRLDCRVQNIDEQLSKLDSDKTLLKEAVCELKERVRAQYQRMYALLEANQAETVQMLESTYTMYARKNSQQVLHLNEKRQESEKLLSSVQSFCQRTESLNFMKNTKPYQLLMDRLNSHLSGALPALRVGQLNSHHFLSDLSTREKNLRKMLDEPFNEASILEIVQSHSSHAGSQLGMSSGLQKRKYSMAFLESNSENSSSQDPSHLIYSSKKPFLTEQSHRSSSVYSSEVLSQTPHTSGRLLDSAAHHMVGLGSSSSHHSGNLFPSSHFPSGGASQQSMYESRKVLMCTLNNCCCSRAPASRAQPPYPAADTFPSQEFPPHAPLSASQPLQHFPVRGLMDASQTSRHPDFYGLYGQSSTKHYGTK